MGRGSSRENKNIYQLAREASGLTILEASEKIGISESKIEKIESGASHIQPEDVFDMASAYNNTALCDYYCNNECPLGTSYHPEIEVKELSVVTLEIVNMLNKLEESKDRLVEITVDGKITPEEMADFNVIKDELEKISMATDSLKVWILDTLEASKNNE